MISRRAFVAVLAVLPFAGPSLATAAPARPHGDTPEAFLTSIYTRITAGDGTTGGAPFYDKEARPDVFVAPLVAVWDKADAETERTGEIGPIEFDPFTDSQDPQVRRFAVKSLETSADKARLRVTLFRDRKPKTGEKPQTVLDFTLAREAGGWRIADIVHHGGDMAWTLREIFSPYR
jgi:hypothetical protein